MASRRYLDAMRRSCGCEPDGGFTLDLDYFRHHREKVAYQWDEWLARSSATLFSPTLEKLLGPRRQADEPLEQRHRDIARSAQAMYEEAFFHLLDIAARSAPV